jgi:hypothetical protein
MSSTPVGVVLVALINRQRRWGRRPAGTAVACDSALSAYSRSAGNREGSDSTTVRLLVPELDVESVVRWGAGERATDRRGLRRSSGTSLKGRMTRLLTACVYMLTIQVNTPTPAECLEPVLHVRRGLRRGGNPIVQPRRTGHDGCFRTVQVF